MSDQQLLILQNDFLLCAGLQHGLGSLQRAAIFQIYVAENDLGVFLAEALGYLEKDHAFLLKGDVFNMDQIEAYMELKWEEVYAFEHTPHPIEFQMYYSV